MNGPPSPARAWVALLDEPPHDATASARVRDAASGEPAGWLAAWMRASKPVRSALRADPAAFDPDGPAAEASLVLVGPERAVIFDDRAVQRARQLVLQASGPWTALTTFVSDEVHFRGALVAAPEGVAFDNPFALVAAERRLRVEAGLLSPGPLRLPSPIVERYAGKPWPQSGF